MTNLNILNSGEDLEILPSDKQKELDLDPVPTLIRNGKQYIV